MRLAHPSAAVAAAVLVAALAAPAAGGRLPARKLDPAAVARLPGGPQALERETLRQRVSGERWRQVHDLVGARHVSQRADARRGAKDAGEAAASDTLRVLLVRIGFDTDASGDLTSVTEDGEFQLGVPDPADPLPIDPPPHDKAYFEAHLRGLSDYYRFQSGGRLHIESRVLPDGAQDSYHLSDIADYGPGAEGFWTLEGLESLVLDMIAAADAGTQADGSVDLSDFADDDPFTYIIFAHAGGDWQSDVMQDSPNDIPTFFVTLGEPVPLISGGTLAECSVIPETTNQDGYKGSIAAALYHEFGHALGLPDVYDATTGLTSVGIWDLMDSGTNLAANIGVDEDSDGEVDLAVPVTGVLPPSLSAWCKWFLGWVVTDELDGAERAVKLPAVGVLRGEYGFFAPSGDFDLADPQVLVAGASSREYFLVENRWVPLLESDTPFDPYDPTDDSGGLFFESDDATGVILWLGGEVDGARRNTGLYDYFLPDGGLLVWHVDMDRIEAELPTNSINRYGDGLRLVEADGIPDIGVLDSYVLGWWGSARDPFSPYNPAGALALEPDGRPDSRAFDGARTGVVLRDVRDDGDAHGAVMRCEAAVEPLAGSFPFTLPDDAGAPRALDPASLVPLAGVLVGADARGALLGISPAGEPAIAPWPLSAPLAGPLAAAPGDLVLAGTRDGRVTALRLGPGDTSFEVAWQATVGDTLLAGPLPLDLGGAPRVLYAVRDGALGLLDGAGQPVGSPVAAGDGPLAAPRVWSRGDGAATIAWFGSDGWTEVTATAAGLAADPPAHPYGGAPESRSRVRPALVPGDDAATLVLPGVGAWRLAAAGPAAAVPWRARLDEPLAADPAVADLDGDGRHDVVGLTARAVHAWQADGTYLTGFPVGLDDLFPLPDSTRFVTEPVVADATGDGLAEVLAATDGGHLIGVTARGARLAGTPYLCADGTGTSLAVVPGAQDDARLLLVSSAGGTAGPPFGRRLSHGRVVGYRLPVGATARSSEWLGPLGGPERTGPQGEPRSLGPLSPLAAAGDAAMVYPNPVRGREATVRFPGAPGSEARLTLFDLQGEEVLRLAFPAGAGPVSEHSFALDVASGVYVCRLEWEGSRGPARTVAPLAVER